MKTPYFFFILIFFGLATSLQAAETYMPTQKASAELETFKSLAGTWEGTVDHGNGPMPVTVIYKITSGGSAVQETVFPGTPQEMVTLYYDKGDTLALTHYCMLQNRPEMILTSSSKNEIQLEFDPACGIDTKTEPHMNSLTVKIHSKNSMTQNWTFFENGVAQHKSPFKLKRVDS